MNNNIIIKQIEYKSCEYNKELELRDKILRQPFGLSINDDNLDMEIDYYHFGAFCGMDLTGVLVLKCTDEFDFPLDKTEIRIKILAIYENYRSKHIGTRLVSFAEEFALKSGYEKLVLFSRTTAVLFYEKLNFKKIGDEFVKEGVPVPLYKMEKVLI